ncbi:RHS repeat-associated core domain protein [compost metagenome]
MFYNYFRSYDARVGRYSQPDPIGLNGGWNRFGYVDANPLAFSDQFGLEKINFFNRNSMFISQKGLGLQADAFPDRDGELLIFGHANSNAIANDSGGGLFLNSRRTMNANELAEYLRKGGIWKPGMPITLYGCETAQGANSIAKKLSEKLKTKVTGFPDKIQFDPRNAQAVPHRPIVFSP